VLFKHGFIRKLYPTLLVRYRYQIYFYRILHGTGTGYSISKHLKTNAKDFDHDKNKFLSKNTTKKTAYTLATLIVFFVAGPALCLR